MGYPAVNISNLGFSYPKNPDALFTNLNLTVADGESFGLFGPNGAGKTTLMSLMTGLLQYQEGDIQLLGKTVKPNDKEVNKLFGLVPQDFSLYEELSPVENLAFFGAWAGLTSTQIKQRTDELLEVMHLADVKDKAVSKFSGGMKRRVNLAIGVIHNPRIVFLDEPTVGVDVQTRHDIINYLKQLNAGGTTLIYTSHQLAEAESLCKKVALIDGGKIVAHDDLSVLLQDHQQDGLEGLFLQLTGKKFED
jgi:ABC-2 type transport system ATP-binding protein